MQLEILTDNKKWVRICKDYWRQNSDGKFVLKVKEIAAIYGMTPYALRKRVEQHAYVWLAISCCTSCKRTYRYRNRSQYQEHYLHKGLICTDCFEVERKAIEMRKKDIIVKLQRTGESTEVGLAKLDLKSTIYLLAAIQALGDEHFTIIEPLSNYPSCTLSPDKDYDKKVLQYLLDNNILLISLNTDLEAIELSEDDEVNINLWISKFHLTLDQHQITELTNQFLDDINIHNIKQTPEFIDLCREIQLNECLGFLKATLRNHQLHLSPGEKTKQVLSQCLKKFSVAQVYSFISCAVRDAAAYYMRSFIYKIKAANTVVGAISRGMEQSLANSSEVRPLNRTHKLPQSSLSRIVFNTVLGTDDGGFTQPLHELIEQKDLLPV